jgi:hypothetical protein
VGRDLDAAAGVAIGGNEIAHVYFADNYVHDHFNQNREGLTFDQAIPLIENLIEKGLLQKYTLTGRQVICYVEKLSPAQVLKFTYRLRAKYPIRAQTPKSRVYEYYNPDRQADAQPVDMTVN